MLVKVLSLVSHELRGRFMKGDTVFLDIEKV